MVTFNLDQSLPYEERGFNVTVTHCEIYDYLDIMRTLLRALCEWDKDLYDREDAYFITKLIEAMLPSPEQLKC